MSTYSSNLKIELIGTGEQVGTWGSTTNSNFSNVFEQAIVGRGTVNFPTDANVTMTYTDSVASQTARNVYLNLTSSGSLSATRDLIVPTINKNYVIQNNTTGGQSIRVITAAGTGITVPNGFTCALYVDGTNVIQASDYLPTLTIGALNVTTLDLTNLEVTNIKAKDGTASASIADSTGVMTIGSSVLTTTDINGGTIDGTAIGSASASSGAFTTLAASGTTTLSGNAIISVTDNSNAALRITQLGTGNALLVEDSSNPDSSPFVINSDGRVLIGSTTATEVVTGFLPSLQVLGTTANTSTSLIGRFSNDGNGAPLVFLKSRGTLGTQGVVGSGDIFANIQMYASDGTSYIQAASIGGAVDGTPGTNDMPGRLVFSTTADGASSPTERMRIGSDGNIGIGGSNFAGQTITISKNATGATTARGIRNTSQVQSDVTGAYHIFNTSPTTAAASFTLSTLNHFDANQGTLGAGSAITNQYGFLANSSLTGATSNFGFFGNIPAGTNRWNFYASGTAANYFAGNVLIGTTSARSALTVAAGDATGNGITVINTNTAANTTKYSTLDFSGTDTVGSYKSSGYVRVVPVDSNYVASAMTFATRSGDAVAERMRLDSSGNLGLGVTPSAWGSSWKSLDMAYATTVATNDSGTAGFGSNWLNNGTNYIYKSGGYAGMYLSSSASSSVHRWFTAPSGTAGNAITFTQAMTLDASGNLGIGTSSPSQKLDVRGAIAATDGGTQTTYISNAGEIELARTAGDAYIDFKTSTAEDFDCRIQQASDGLRFLTGGNGSSSERMRIDSSGNVGIGTSSPASKLHVQRSNDGVIGTFRGTSNAQLELSVQSGNLIYDSGNGNATHVWQSNTTERMRIDSSGNLLVGTTSAGGDGVTLYVRGSAGGTTSYFNFNRASTASSGTVLSFQNAGSGVGSVSHTNTSTSFNTSSDYRLKDITGELTGYKERVMALQPKQGLWKADGSEFRGFLAHEFANQYPSLVNGEKDAVDAEGKPVYQGMQAGGSETIADLVALAKEQQAIIQSQADTISAMDARLTALENK